MNACQTAHHGNREGSEILRFAEDDERNWETPPDFYSTLVSSRNRCNSMKINDRVHFYSTIYRGGVFLAGDRLGEGRRSEKRAREILRRKEDILLRMT
jgi:hypothetical protein